MAEGINIFYSYAHEDERMRKKLEKHLALLRRQDLITEWHDRDISAGTEWAREINAHLETAQIILLLISSSFLDSKYCYSSEMVRALERHDAGTARVIPVILRPVYWQNAPFSKLQVLPTDGRPIAGGGWRNIDEAFANVAHGIHKAVDELRVRHRKINSMSSAHDAYLAAMAERYDRVILPIDPSHTFALESIYQPLRLLRDPVIPGSLRYHEGDQQMLEDKELRDLEYSGFDQRVRDRRSAQPGSIRVEASNELDALFNKTANRRIVILGGPGSGKTTLLQRLISHEIEKWRKGETALLPVFISLPDWARKGGPISDYLKSTVIALKDQNPVIEESYASELWQAIQRGEALLCLDGLDEVKADQRPDKIRWINDNAGRIGGAWVIGSRFADYQGKQFSGGQFAEWELQPLDDLMRHELAISLFPTLHQIIFGEQSLMDLSPENFVSTLAEHPQAAAWGQNPLLFSLLAYLYVKNKTLPTSRAEMYHDVIDAVMSARESIDAERAITRGILAEMALRLYRTHGRSFTLTDIRAALPRVIRDLHQNEKASEMEQRIRNCGLLSPVAIDGWGFRHQAFQEYLVAQALSFWLMQREEGRYEDTMTLLRDVHARTRWIEPLALLVGVLCYQRGREGRKWSRNWLSELIALSAKNEDPGYLALALALRSLVEIPYTKGVHREEEKLYVSTLTTWREVLIDSARHGKRILTERMLQIAGDLRHLPPDLVAPAIAQLINALSDASTVVRQKAAQALGQMHANVAIPALITALSDKDDDVAQVAAQALGELHAEEAIPALADVLFGMWVVSKVKQAAARALIQLQATERAIPAAIAALAESGDDVDGRVVRWIMTQALGHLGAKSAIPVLLSLLVKFSTGLSSDPKTMQVAVIEALSQLHAEEAIPDLITALSDNDKKVCEAAAQALGELHAEEAIPALITILTAINSNSLLDRDIIVRQTVAQALGQLQGKEAILALITALSDESFFVRIVVARALGQSQAREAIPALSAALSDESEYVRQAAAQALAQLHAEGAIFTTPSANQRQVRQVAVETLGHLRAEATIPTLLATFSDTNSAIRAAVAQALGQLHAEEAISSLITATSDESGSVREAAVQALGQFHTEASIAALITALSSRDSDIRSAAAQALGQLQAREAIPALIRALSNFRDDGYGLARQKAAEVLGQLHAEEAIPALLTALSHNIIEIRLGATKALGHLCVKEAIPTLLAACSDENRAIREVTAEALGRLHDESTIPALLTYLSAKQWGSREAAALALGYLHVEEAIPALLVALFNSDYEAYRLTIQTEEQGVDQLDDKTDLAKSFETALAESFGAAFRGIARQAAAQALGHLNAVEAIPALLTALSDGESEVRQGAAQALGELQAKEAVPALLSALADESGSVRQATARALGRLQAEVAVPALIQASCDLDKDARNAALDALKQIKPETLEGIIQEAEAVLSGSEYHGVLVNLSKALDARTFENLGLDLDIAFDRLAECLENPYWETRRNAARALGKIGKRVPTSLKERLYALRHDEIPAVREATDDALAEILTIDPIEG